MTPQFCPYCLSQETFRISHDKGISDESDEGDSEQSRTASRQGPGVYRCPKCREKIAPMYVKGYEKYPPSVGAAVGFTGHGKTVYFASLLHELRGERLPRVWPRFHSLALDDSSLATVQSNMNQLREGFLPAASPKNFPRPTLMRLSGIPWLGGSTLCLYDVSGEAFLSGAGIGEYARYVSRARTVLFLISLCPGDLKDYGRSPGEALMNLINGYILAAAG